MQLSNVLQGAEAIILASEPRYQGLILGGSKTYKEDFNVIKLIHWEADNWKIEQLMLHFVDRIHQVLALCLVLKS